MQLENSTFANKLKTFQQNNTSVVSSFVALIGLCIILSFLSPAFLTADNLISVMLQSTLVSILAVAETFIIISGGIDLSVGSIVALSSALMGQLVVNNGMDPVVGIILALAVGCAIGFLHGILITKINIPPFIVTLGALTIWRGIAFEFTKGQNIYGLPDVITWLGRAYIGPIPVAVIVSIIIFVVAWFILARTKLGLYTFAIGGNENAARLSGININKTKILLYVIGGFLCAVAGIVVAGRMNGTSALVANGYELDAIAAVAIGGTSLSGGVGNIWGTLIGSIMIQIIRNGLNLLNISPYYQMVVIGIVIIFAVGLDCMRKKKG